jgi:23S rRNA pseudouridine1911/1915/1917 synthase
MPEQLSWTVPPGAGRLDRGLADAFPQLSRARLQALIAAGAVTVDGSPAKASMKPEAGAEVRVLVPDAADTGLVGEDIPLEVLHEDEDLIVVVKPAGMVVHPSAGHMSGTLVHALLGRAGSLSTIGGELRPGIVHRLDSGTSGVMVVARNDVAHRRLAELFAVHDLDRRYLAVVHRVPIHDAGVFRSHLARDPDNRLRVASVPEVRELPEDEFVRPERIGEAPDEDEDDLVETGGSRERRGRLAITHWRTRARGDRVALVEARLETGRTHQVRVHLSEAGHPLLGDTLYGRRDCVAPAPIREAVGSLGRPMLHAWHLGFAHPRTGAPLAFTVPPPPDFLAMCARTSLAVPGEVQPWNPAPRRPARG